ncbi:uncharacterized protein FTOL_05733 [Fusarium torulosum]|uniref:Uncharacterized protein n=1 Tax=Fusarium torulosum TaxID=33205 RepID=A0AAE8M8I9_9HYPO|nr:uncharacterized protein FTOL_05733 [Fusarium torulosum]
MKIAAFIAVFSAVAVTASCGDNCADGPQKRSIGFTSMPRAIIAGLTGEKRGAEEVIVKSS